MKIYTTFFTGLFMYSHQNRTLPLKFDCKFTLQKEVHSCHTRNSHLYRLPLCRTNIKQFSVFYQGPKFYNSTSTEIVNSSSSVSLKIALKAFSVITINSFHTNVFKYHLSCSFSFALYPSIWHCNCIKL